MQTHLRLSMISLALFTVAAPASAGHRHAGNDRAIILQNNGMHSTNDNGGIILQNHNPNKAMKNRGGIILQDSASNGEQLPPAFRKNKAASQQDNGSIILHRKNRGGIILQNQAKGAAGGQ